jgi:transmembrane sensor
LIVVFSVGYYFIDKELAVGRPGSYKAELISSGAISQALNDFVRGFNAGKAGIKIEKKENGELVYIAPDYPHAAKDKYYEVITPRGGQFSIQFPDGTIAWLNAESSIKYPANFSQDSINMIVEGEVYFEVAQNTKHLYTVSLPSTVNRQPSTNKSLLIKTSNAHFDIENYHDVDSGITLFEGVATVEADFVGSKDIASEIVHPGEEAKIFTTRIIVAMVQNENEITAWKNGMTTYHKAPIQMIMSDISRWYDVDVEYMGKIPDKTFNLNMPRDTNLKELLAVLREQGIHLNLHAGKVTVSQ